MLDQLVATIDGSRANTRRALVAALAPKAAGPSRKRAAPRKPTYGYGTLKALVPYLESGRQAQREVFGRSDGALAIEVGSTWRVG